MDPTSKWRSRVNPNGIPQSETPVSQRVVENVADARNTSPLDLPPLFDCVDPDALDRLFSDGPGSTVRDQGRLTFPMAGCEVTVWADGTVEADVLGGTDGTPTSVRNAPTTAEPSD